MHLQVKNCGGNGKFKMKVFISGGAKSGKSSLAQRLAVQLAGSGKRYYVATMIPTDAVDRRRIELHIEDRDGLGFETLECPRNISSSREFAESDKQAVFLFDSVTAYLQNALFPAEKNYEPDFAAAEKCAEELLDVAAQVKHIIFVSDYIYSDAYGFEDFTETYRRGLAHIDRALAKACDQVIEVTFGFKYLYK